MCPSTEEIDHSPCGLGIGEHCPEKYMLAALFLEVMIGPDDVVV